MKIVQLRTTLNTKISKLKSFQAEHYRPNKVEDFINVYGIWGFETRIKLRGCLLLVIFKALKLKEEAGTMMWQVQKALKLAIH